MPTMLILFSRTLKYLLYTIDPPTSVHGCNGNVAHIDTEGTMNVFDSSHLKNDDNLCCLFY